MPNTEVSKASRPRIMVDMSATLIHHGHIRLLKKAAELGDVVVALTSDEEVRTKKGYQPELSFAERKEVLEAVKYVTEVVESPWLITEDYVNAHHCDFLVHGADNSNVMDPARLVIFPRTEGVSSTELRERVLRVMLEKMRAGKPEATKAVGEFITAAVQAKFETA